MRGGLIIPVAFTQDIRHKCTNNMSINKVLHLIFTTPYILLSTNFNIVSALFSIVKL